MCIKLYRNMTPMSRGRWRSSLLAHRRKLIAFFLCYVSSSEELVRFVRSCALHFGRYVFIAMCLIAVLRVFLGVLRKDVDFPKWYAR